MLQLAARAAQRGNTEGCSINYIKLDCANSVTILFYAESMARPGEDQAEKEDAKKLSDAFPQEKSLWKKLKSRLHHSNVPHSMTWRVARKDLANPIWNHKGKQRWIIKWQHKYKLDNLGKHKPIKLSFRLYPRGEFEDTNKAVTMAVHIIIPSKCPPLAPSSELRLSLTVREDDEELKTLTVEEKLNMNTFYIYNLINHDHFKVSTSKYFYFDIEASCSTLQ